MMREMTRMLVVWLVLGVAPVLAGQFARPVPDGGGPTVVECVIAVLDVDEISDASQNFTVSIYSVFQWHDPREAHDGARKVVKALGEIWHPHISFVNMQRTWSEGSEEIVEISSEGTLTLRRRFWGDFSQPLNLRDFPLDTQRFEIRVAAAGSDGEDEVVLVPDRDQSSFITEHYSVADWRIKGFEVRSEAMEIPTGPRVPSFVFIFTAERLSNHYLVKVIAPMLLIIILSWVVFWLDPKDGGSQLGVAVTAFLTVIAYHITLSSRLPMIPYLTRLDIFVFGATSLVFLAMIEVVITTNCARSGHLKRARWMDRVSRILFPAMLAAITIYAFELR